MDIKLASRLGEAPAGLWVEAEATRKDEPTQSKDRTLPVGGGDPSQPSLPGGSDISALVILIEFNCLLQVTLKPFQSPLKLGTMDNSTPWGL